MKCQVCQAQNPRTAQFCIECGAPMRFVCPKCGELTPFSGKFCMKCGHNIGDSKNLRKSNDGAAKLVWKELENYEKEEVQDVLNSNYTLEEKALLYETAELMLNSNLTIEEVVRKLDISGNLRKLRIPVKMDIHSGGRWSPVPVEGGQ